VFSVLCVFFDLFCCVVFSWFHVYSLRQHSAENASKQKKSTSGLLGGSGAKQIEKHHIIDCVISFERKEKKKVRGRIIQEKQDVIVSPFCLVRSTQFNSLLLWSPFQKRR
jgi:hypothetical protein